MRWDGRMSDSPADGRIRPATAADVPEVLAMIRDLAHYERSLHEVETTEDQLTVNVELRFQW